MTCNRPAPACSIHRSLCCLSNGDLEPAVLHHRPPTTSPSPLPAPLSPPNPSPSGDAPPPSLQPEDVLAYLGNRTFRQSADDWERYEYDNGYFQPWYNGDYDVR